MIPSRTLCTKGSQVPDTKASLCPLHLFFSSYNIIFKFYLFFIWRIIALQNFVVFCQLSTWISHRYTPFLEYRTQASFSLLELPWVPRSRFKYMLIKEGRGWGEKGGIVKRSNSPALGSILENSLKGYMEQYFWAVSQTPKPSPGGRS